MGKRIAILCVLLVLLGAGVLWHFITRPGVPWDRVVSLGAGDPIPVVVRPGMNGRQAAAEFEKAGIIETGRAGDLARWMARFSIDRSLHPGTYLLRRGTPWKVARQLEAAKSTLTSATIVPGTDLFSLPESISAVPLKREELESLLMDDRLYPRELVALLPDSAEGRVAFLFPETYYVAEKRAEEVLASASALWWSRVGSAIPPADRTKERVGELAVVASLVEREGYWDDERPRIAGVIANRRMRDMQLQIDATVVYAWKRTGRTLTRVLHKDLEIDSPYNTYRVPGLPPTAICTSSWESWSAVLAPERTEYLYYVAQEDRRHLFATTYDGHLQNIRAVRKK